MTDDLTEARREAARAAIIAGMVQALKRAQPDDADEYLREEFPRAPYSLRSQADREFRASIEADYLDIVAEQLAGNPDFELMVRGAAAKANEPAFVIAGEDIPF